MSATRRDSATRHPVSDTLSRLIADGALSADAHQAEAARVLDRVARELAAPPPRGFFGRRRTPEPVRGAYLVGAVGRGKTMLMDLFYAALPVPGRRTHFNEFMDEVHARVTDHRRAQRQSGDSTDPVAAVAEGVGNGLRVLCLDEFQVDDITNAMLLGRLFGALFSKGTTIVATSNTVPDELYLGGLNRQLILPFIAELKARVDVVPLDGPLDYRQAKFRGEHVFVFGADADARAELDRLWLRLTGGLEGAEAKIESLGRTIRVPRAAMGAARFSFAELCETPLGARDYLKLAHAYDTLVIDGVPRFERTRSDAARRFILLVDTLYDRGVKLAARFEAPIEDLAGDDRTAGAFQRTASRLAEMQSSTYLESPHKMRALPND